MPCLLLNIIFIVFWPNKICGVISVLFDFFLDLFYTQDVIYCREYIHVLLRYVCVRASLYLGGLIYKFSSMYNGIQFCHFSILFLSRRPICCVNGTMKSPSITGLELIYIFKSNISLITFFMKLICWSLLCICLGL